MVNTPMKDRTGGGWKRLWRGLLAGTLAVATLAGTLSSAAYADPISGGSSQDAQSDTTTVPDPSAKATGPASTDAVPVLPGDGSSAGYAPGTSKAPREAGGAAPGTVPDGPQLYSGGSDYAPGGPGTVAGAIITWKYRDNNDGGWGGFTLANFKKALAATTNTTGGKINWNEYPGAPAAAKAQEAMDGAKAECLTRFDQLHPSEKGKGKCRMVGVGVVATPTTHNYDGNGYATSQYWSNAWDQLVKSRHFQNNGKQYKTSDAFSDDKGMSVDKLASKAWSQQPPVVIVIALNQYEPAPTPPQNYKLTVSTKATGRFGTAGGTNPVTDAITLNNNANSKEKVTGQITLTAITLDGKTHVSPLKRFTTSVASSVNVKFSPGDVVKSWKTWPAGEYWFDVAIPKQQHMEAEARHNGRNDQNESWKAGYKLTVNTKATGHTLTGGSQPVTDTITLSNNGNASETVNGKITLNANTGNATVTKTKEFTGKTNGDTQVSSTPIIHPAGRAWQSVVLLNPNCSIRSHAIEKNGVFRVAWLYEQPHDAM